MTAKFQHGMTKAAQKAAAIGKKSKKKSAVVLAPTPMLYSKVVLKDGTRGSIVGYAGTASDQTYTLRDTFGRETKITRDSIASYK